MANLTNFPSMPLVQTILSGNCRICDQSQIISLNRQRPESDRQACLGERLHESGDGVPVTNIRAGLITHTTLTFAAAELIRCVHVMAQKVFVA